MVQIVAGSHPALYSRLRYLFASGALVIVVFAASYFNNLLLLNATAYKFTASVICSASLKLPGYCFPVLHASINFGKASEVSCTWFRLSVFTLTGASIFLPEMICGFCTLKPARILPLSPTNIIPSCGNSLLSLNNSIGVCGRIPPSYQHRSTGGLLPFAGYLKRTMLAMGKEKSLAIRYGTGSCMPQTWLRLGSI